MRSLVSFTKLYGQVAIFVCGLLATRLQQHRVGGALLLMRKGPCRFWLASWRRREQKIPNRANRRVWRFLMRQMAHAFEGHQF